MIGEQAGLYRKPGQRRRVDRCRLHGLSPGRVSQNAREAILHGVNTLANAVRVTLGPRGRNVVIEKSWGAPVGAPVGIDKAVEVIVEGFFSSSGC